MASLRYQIDVDLDVFKALTSRLEQDGQTHNDILRDILSLDSPFEAEPIESPISVAADRLARAVSGGHFYSRGLTLPNGTELRARHKGKEYRAIIVDGKLLTEDKTEHESPSAAANHITSTTVNGLRFWEGRRPGDSGWRRLDVIRDSAR